MRIYVEKRPLIIILAIVAVVLVPLAIWQVQSLQMRTEFIREMKAGRVTQFPPYLADKVWTDRDLATANVRKVVRSYGRERALSTAAYNLGQHTLPSTAYSYQAAITDTSTGMKYVFGRSRRQPGQWTWAGIHPDSHEQWIQERAREMEEFEGKHYDEQKLMEMRRSPPPRGR